MSNLESRRMLSVGQMQNRLGIGRSKAYSLITTRSIPSVRIGGLVKVRKEDLERYIEENRY